MTNIKASVPALAMLDLVKRLVLRFGLQLALVALLGAIARALLLEGAVALGFVNRLAGLAFLTLVVLADLVIVVVLFEMVRPGLPALDAAARGSAEAPEPAARRRPAARRYATSVTLALVPFFAFYAAWGFLGDAVRDYSKLALAVTPLGERVDVLDVSGGLWLAASVAVAWGIRRGAKFMRERTGVAVWDVLIVLCEALWAFIVLFVISNWKDEILGFAAGLPERIGGWLSALAPVAAAVAATIPPPVESAPPDVREMAQGLFFYALYPVVQLTIAALIYGYDVHGAEEPGAGRLGRAVARWRAVPNQARDFVGHFLAGLWKRYRALANGVRLTLGAGVSLITLTIVGWRLLDWLAAWSWAGAFRLIGPHELVWQQVFADWASLLLGPPSAPGDGILLVPFKICLLAAALETAFAGGATFRRPAVAKANLL
jgi:hypothetical protein